jgi:hypothetical protein
MLSVILFCDAFAADTAEATKPQPTTPSTAQPQAPAKPPAESKKEEQAAKESAEGDPDKGPSPQRFVPSEQVRADFDVSFPIDI